MREEEKGAIALVIATMNDLRPHIGNGLSALDRHDILQRHDKAQAELQEFVVEAKDIESNYDTSGRKREDGHNQCIDNSLAKLIINAMRGLNNE